MNLEEASYHWQDDIFNTLADFPTLAAPIALPHPRPLNPFRHHLYQGTKEFHQRTGKKYFLMSKVKTLCTFGIETIRWVGARLPASDRTWCFAGMLAVREERVWSRGGKSSWVLVGGAKRRWGWRGSSKGSLWGADGLSLLWEQGSVPCSSEGKVMDTECQMTWVVITLQKSPGRLQNLSTEVAEWCLRSRESEPGTGSWACIVQCTSVRMSPLCPKVPPEQ